MLKLVSIRLDPSDWDEFKLICERQDTTAAEQLRSLISQHINPQPISASLPKFLKLADLNTQPKPLFPLNP